MVARKPELAGKVSHGEFTDPVTDLGAIAAMACVLLVVRWAIHAAWTREWAKRMMNLDGKQLSSSDALGVEKFCKYMWHMVVYLILEVWAVKLQLDLPWSVFNTGTIDSVWDRFPHSGTEKAAVKLFMMAQVAWYVHGFFESLIVDKGRSDFIVMLIHHVMSSILLLGAYWGNAHRVAILVCVEQDLSDILMYISKMVQKSIAVPWTQNKALHTYLLCQLTVAWGSTRVLVLGSIVWRFYVVVGPTGIMDPGGPNSDSLSIFLIVQLSLLWFMQLFWWLGLCKMTFDQVIKGTFNDFFHDTKKKAK